MNTLNLRELNAHHVHAWSEHPEFRHDPRVMATLCRTCHTERAHNGGKWKTMNPQIKNLLLKLLKKIHAVLDAAYYTRAIAQAMAAGIPVSELPPDLVALVAEGSR